jgi:hypothetical protein
MIPSYSMTASLRGRHFDCGFRPRIYSQLFYNCPSQTTWI